MKKLAKLSIIALAVSSLAACNKEAKVEDAAAKPAAEAAAKTTSAFTTDVEKQSYSIGASFGRYLKENLTKVQRLVLKLTMIWYFKGFKKV